MQTRSHMVIPDLQIRKGVPMAHLDWIGEYIVDRRVDVAIQIGDAFDMYSLNPHRKRRELEGARYDDDIESGRDGMARIIKPVKRARLGTRMVQLGGNHEWFIFEAIQQDPTLDGQLSLDHIKCHGWEFHDFNVPVEIDGVVYAHFFYHPLTGKPLGGTVENRLQKLGHSFTMGHQQTLLMGMRFVKDRSQHGLVAGACYLHDEDYKGPQGNAHWRGVIVKHEVREGSYDIMTVSLDFLCRKYEGMPLKTFLAKGGK
jgi:hypothetical protein